MHAVNTLANSHLNRAVIGPGVVAPDAECRKQLKYENISQTHCSFPWLLRRSALSAKKRLLSWKISADTLLHRQKELRSFEFLMQHVSVVIQRGNAACVLGTTFYGFRSCSDSVSRWMSSNRLKLNPSKTELIWLHSSRRNPGFIQNDIELFVISLLQLGLFVTWAWY